MGAQVQASCEPFYAGLALHQSSFEVARESDFRVEFAPPEPSIAPAPAVERSPFSKAPEPEKAVAFVPGTLFFDDDSPINPLDLVLNPPPIDARKGN